MEDDETPLLNEIGITLGQDPDYPETDSLLYVEAVPGMFAISVFKDLGDRVLFRDFESLDEPVMDLWYAADPEKRWAAMEYMVRDGRFDANFTYSEEMDQDKDSMDRRDAVIRKYYGDKPVEYPPLVDDD